MVEPHDPVRIPQVEQRFHHAPRDRHRAPIRHDEASDAVGAIDRSPTIAFEIKTDENVGREQRRPDGAELTRMAHRARDLRQEARKTLSLELQLGAALPPIQGLCRVPPRPKLGDPSFAALAQGAYHILADPRIPPSRLSAD